jgi:hypothetical protein
MPNWESIARGLADSIERLHGHGVISMTQRDKIMVDFDKITGNWKNLAGIMHQALVDGNVQYAIDVYLEACGVEMASDGQ